MKTLVERAERWLFNESPEDDIPDGWKKVETALDLVMEHLWAGVKTRSPEKWIITPNEFSKFKEGTEDFAYVTKGGNQTIHIHKNGAGKYVIAYDTNNSDVIALLKEVVKYVGAKSDISIG